MLPWAALKGYLHCGATLIGKVSSDTICYYSDSLFLNDTFWPNCIAGNNGVPLHFHGELLRLIIKQKKMILLDKKILSSFFTSLLNSSPESLLVHQAVGKRLTFDWVDCSFPISVIWHYHVEYTYSNICSQLY